MAQEIRRTRPVPPKSPGGFTSWHHCLSQLPTTEPSSMLSPYHVTLDPCDSCQGYHCVLIGLNSFFFKFSSKVSFWIALFSLSDLYFHLLLPLEIISNH